MKAQAFWSLGISIATAFLVMLLFVILFRLSVRAQQLARIRDKEKQLLLLGQMSAVLGHELRNPLTSLKGHAQLLLEQTPIESKMYKGTQTVVREAVRLERLTEQVLAFVRSGEISPQLTDPYLLLEQSVEQVSGHPIQIDRSQTTPLSWRMDPDRMQQVLVNLLRNAVQADSSAHPIEVWVGQEKDMLVYRIRDHGRGIPKEELRHLFEPFFTKKTKGTGLGLAVSYTIVQGHHGTLSADNHPGGGSVFTVAVPQQIPAANET